MVDSLLHFTSQYFDSVNFTELDETWIDEVIENEFTDVDECELSTSFLFDGEPSYVLLNICRICNNWTLKPTTDDFEESDAGNVSTRPEEVLWTYLDQMGISIKQISAVIFFLCSKAVKVNSSHDDKKIGLLSAKWYFCILRVPGSSAYSVFNSNLFRLSIDCFQVADLIDSKDALFKWRDFEALFPTMISTLQSVVPLMSVCHFGTDSTTVDHVIRKLSELVVAEISNSRLNFDLDFLTVSERDFRKYSKSYVLTCLAYHGLSTLLNSDLNGEKEDIFAVVLSFLKHHILCVKTKKTPIPAKFLTIKDNAVLFICHHLENNKELFSTLTLNFLKRLCLSVIDKVDFRAVVSHAILSIMLHLKVLNLIEFIQWLLLLVDAAEMSNRVFAIEILARLLNDIPQVDREGLPDSLEVYLSPLPIIFAILTRCDDVSPAVRTKALNVLAQNMKCILKALMENQDPSIFPEEEFDEDLNNFEVNGEHRSFWYRFSSFEDRVKEIINILHRRIEDNNGIARKAALQGLENIITFDPVYLTDENLKLFLVAAKDQNIVMRKQTIQSLATILETYLDNIKAQESWLKCIMPLVQDPENTVQAKVLSVLEEKFLQDILSDKNHERDATFLLLAKLSYGEFLSHQRYLQKAFCCWRTEKKLRPQLVSRLEKLFGSDKDELIWFYLSIFAAFCKLPTKICEFAVEEFQREGNWKSYSYMENILKVLKCTFSDLRLELLESVISILKEKIRGFAAPVEVAPLMIETLCKIERHLERNDEFTKFGEKMIKIAMNTLTPYISNKKSHQLPAEEVVIQSLTVIKEFCHIFPKCISENLIVLLKSFVYTRNGSSSLNFHEVSSTLRAHAIASLGKLCLQDEALGRELLPFLAKELMTSKEDMLRNNAVLILIEMCKRYTSYADMYIPIISICFKDKRYMVRYQSITLLVSLLQEEFIKSKGTLLYCLLATIIDKKEAIQELGKYCLCTLLYEKKKTIFRDHFIDAIFVFNNYPPPDNERVSQIVIELEKFAFMYDENREKRMQIYRFMLSYMEGSSYERIVSSICHGILTSVADAVFPINTVTICVVRDCFAILNSKEIRAYNSDSMSHELEEGEEETVAKVELEFRKSYLVQPAIPAIILLFNTFKHGGKYDLMRELTLFVVEFLFDYSEEVNDLLAEDRDLCMQVGFEYNQLKKETCEEKKEKKAKEEREKKKEAKTSHTSEKAELEESHFKASLSMCNSLVVRRPTPQSRSMSKRTSPENLNLTNNDIHKPSSSGLQSVRHAKAKDTMFSSTPHVCLKPLKFKSPNISRITLNMDDIDLDSD
ncbi:condensin-2 complex subunit D3 [Nephila pilipes]|uniref:Condensin-2 complex subunit D3 n=1 Tax=Nephila pilipes TaxID=299642 RepID=A0A8X6Q6I4_NEPPI|nr:condensin-2 complex subunit D3 [Nephila pilipes]